MENESDLNKDDSGMEHEGSEHRKEFRMKMVWYADESRSNLKAYIEEGERREKCDGTKEQKNATL